MSQAGRIYIVSAPSGAGKTSLVRALLDDPDCKIHLSISTTTRTPRPGEQHGREYFFTTREEFQARAAAGEFIEWAEVHGNLYGTSRETTAQALSRGDRLLLEIDWQGAAQVRAQFPNQVTSIFIMPPSLQELRRRLDARGQDSAEVVEARIQAAAREIARAPDFDHVIMNQDFSVAVQTLKSLISQQVSPL